MDGQEAKVHRGQQMPDFALPVVPTGAVRVSDFRNRQNLIIIFGGNEQQSKGLEKLYQDLAQNQSDLEWEDTQVLWVTATRSAAPAETQIFPLLVDEGGKVYQSLFGRQAEREPIYLVLDRFGELYDYGSIHSVGEPVGAQELLDMVRFIELQCPE